MRGSLAVAGELHELEPGTAAYLTAGETYEVDCQGRSCSCPDAVYRCQPNGLKCKHAIAAVAAVAAGEVRSW